mgnify:CR=1 FL=1
MKDSGVLDATKLDLVGRMGENWYCRVNKEALFEIEKPTRSKGIGVDSLPRYVRESKVLTGNNLGKLGNLERLPTKEELQNMVTVNKDQEDIHISAKRMIEMGKPKEALALLISALS